MNMSKGFRGPKAPDPSPTEIRRVCGEIQAAWSPRERKKRGGRQEEEKITDDTRAEMTGVILQTGQWTPPVIRLHDIDYIEGPSDYDG